MGVAMLCIGTTAIMVTATLVLEYKGRHAAKAVCKAAASTGFLAMAVAMGALHSRYGQCVLVGLVLSWWGDVFLAWRSERLFLAGTVSFLLAHVAYVAAFCLKGVDAKAVVVAALVLIPCAFVAGRLFVPRAPAPLKGPLLAYIAVISTMAALAAGAAFGPGPRQILLAAAMFYVSDVAVAIDRFVAPRFLNALWGLPLYYAAQLLFAATANSPS